MKDHKGRELEEGCRVRVPPRLIGDPYTLAPSGFEGSVAPGISGRIHRIKDGTKGPVADIVEERTGSMRSVPLELCRRQYGASRKEKDEMGAEKRGQRLR